MMWEKLDSVVDDLEDKVSADPKADAGFALGVATCIAIVEDPYGKDVNKIRKKAVERRREREEAAGS